MSITNYTNIPLDIRLASYNNYTNSILPPLRSELFSGNASVQIQRPSGVNIVVKHNNQIIQPNDQGLYYLPSSGIYLIEDPVVGWRIHSFY